MSELDLDEIANDPKFKFRKDKNKAKFQRTVDDLFSIDVGQRKVSDKRGRPWLNDPQKFVQDLVDQKSEDGDLSSEEDDSVEEEYDINNIDQILKDSDYADLESIFIFLLFFIIEATYLSLIENAPIVQNESKRLALMHFDWDNGKADDIYVLMQSFLPERSRVLSVVVYPSMFGIERMAEEEQLGPRELRTSEHNDVEIEEENQVYDLDAKNAWHEIPEKLKSKLRDYEIARLKYFYAIIEFDSIETASIVYKMCDGMEYETSGTCLDLRFVPDDMKFDVAPEWSHLVSSSSDVNKTKYKPKKFETKALQSTRLGLGWDKTPKERTTWLQSQFKDENDPDETMEKKYLVLSSSGASTAASSDVDDPGPAETVPRIRKHRPPKVAPDKVRKLLLGDFGINERKVDSDPSSDESYEEYDLGSDNESKIEPKDELLNEKDMVDEIDDNCGSSGSEPDCQKTKQAYTKKQRRANMKERIKLKAEKKKSNQMRQKMLWRNADDSFVDDARFDSFWINPGFSVNQTHKHYEVATEFLQFIKSRKK